MATTVLIGGTLPGLLRDIVSRFIDSSDDIAVLHADIEEVSRLTEYLTAHDVDVAIVGCEPTVMDSVGRELLHCRRQLSVIAVSSRGDDSTLFTLTPTAQSLGELSPQALLDVIHDHHPSAADPHTKH